MDLLAQMATFVRIVEGGSLSAAARRLRLSTPAISRQLRALEEELGATLVLRTTRRLTVTEVGRTYYERCVQILREVEEAQAGARRSDAVEGRLVVAASVTFGGLRVAPTLPALFAKHPRLRIDLRLEDRITDLVGDGVDVAIRATTLVPSAADGLIGVPLATVPRVAVAAPSYLRRRGEPKEPAALARHDALVQVFGSGAPAIRWRFTKGPREEVVPVREVLACNVLAVLRDAAVAGLGVALLPDWLVAQELAAGQLRAILPQWTTAGASVAALYRVELRGTPRVRAFVEHLRGALG
ncbi:LysR family transcriptional regulator [Nannocystis bainbridge]|uniref:LysR family transcriptional regulator n=1 Tax=Nannocystis bainbridge TaxID=2995303 RepID=A0ABT5E937_9BACT|nr:LysR family transcriptional regulator [Nannocystis bainbridge]MDC0721428.1 LysR family transcriptional regulator [Nannocystis bainbridge]